MLKVIFITAPLFLVAGCAGGDSDSDPPTATDTTDTDTDTDPGPESDWATPCGGGLGDCPAGQECFSPPLPNGSTTQGYCTPSCSVEADCTDGYFGPGEASCFTPPNCLISCSQAYQDGTCPEGLTCIPTGGPTNACGVPQ